MRYLVTMPEGEERDSFLTPPVREKLNAMGEVIWNTTGRHLREAEVIEMGRGASAVITCWGSPMLTAEAVRQMPALKLVIHLAGTVQPYVSEAVYRMGVRVISGNRFFAESLAEGALAYILCALRDIPYYSGKLMKEKQWLPPAGNRGILDRTVGLVSFGAIAQNLAHNAAAFPGADQGILPGRSGRDAETVQNAAGRSG